MARAFTNLEFVLIGREEYDKLTADHAEVAELRARNERQKRGIRQFADALGQERQRAEKAEGERDQWKAAAQSHLDSRVNVLNLHFAGAEDLKRQRDALVDQAEADAQVIDRLAKERNQARAERDKALKVLGEKLDQVPLWLGLQDPWLAQHPGPT
ncbi:MULTISPECIES: hypothetical protein [Rhodococcus]|uniref:hypothetical protein n=1 Tax=Rhodococcus TaxID=1827 RepID=UPI000C7D53D3|nr:MULTISPECIES: hypothetical protein [Rhodococcus]AUM18247.1 hypothetical protein CSW53_17985 [Rhodococcus ruber]